MWIGGGGSKSVIILRTSFIYSPKLVASETTMLLFKCNIISDMGGAMGTVKHIMGPKFFWCEALKMALLLLYCCRESCIVMIS